MEDEWLVASESGILECVVRECGPEEVMVEGKCYHVDETTLCQGRGEAIFLNVRGVPSCQCKDGWGWKKKKVSDNFVFGAKKQVKSGGQCYQEFTEGFFTRNFLVKSFESERSGCINNPCGDSTESVPH